MYINEKEDILSKTPEELEEYLTPLPSIDEVVVLARENDNKELTITALVYPNEELFAGKTKEEILG